MPRLVLFELAMLVTPFALFGLYRLAVKDAQIEGRKAWPINLLFGAGVVLAVLAWLFLILREERQEDICTGPSSFDPVSGEVVPGEEYKCDLGLPPRPGVPVVEETAEELVEDSGQ